MNSHTGSFDPTVAFAGAHTLANRQSSSWPSAFGYGTAMPRQIGPNVSAARSPASSTSGSAGALHRRPPVGAAAYRSPKYWATPPSVPTSEPWYCAYPKFTRALLGSEGVWGFEGLVSRLGAFPEKGEEIERGTGKGCAREIEGDGEDKRREEKTSRTFLSASTAFSWFLRVTSTAASTAAVMATAPARTANPCHSLRRRLTARILFMKTAVRPGRWKQSCTWKRASAPARGGELSRLVCSLRSSSSEAHGA